MTPSFQDAARDYIGKHEHLMKRSDRQWGHLKRYIDPAIGDVPVDQVGVDHMVAVLQPIWHAKHPTAKQVKALLADIIAWASAHGWRGR